MKNEHKPKCNYLNQWISIKGKANDSSHKSLSKSREPKFSHTTFQCQKMLTKIADCWEILEEYCGIFTFYGNTDSAMFYLSGFEVLETGTYFVFFWAERTSLVLSIQFCCFIASSVYRNLITT